MSREARPILGPVAAVVEPHELSGLASPSGLVACDFYVRGIEQGESVPGGYERDGIVNVDHHANTERMRRPISSTNLALERVAACGLPRAGTPIVINHTDCDSVLSAALLLGTLAPEPRWGVAAVAADHTGEENAIGDLLQALDARRDYEASLEALLCLEAGRGLPAEAEAALAERHSKRRAAADLVSRGAFKSIGSVAYAVLISRTDGEFFPALLPEAALIAIFVPHADDRTGRVKDVKLRLGKSAPLRASLHDLHINAFDPAYGGRWNAGSNKRGGGTVISPASYVGRLTDAAERAWREPDVDVR